MADEVTLTQYLFTMIVSASRQARPESRCPMTKALILDDSDAIKTVIRSCLGSGFDCVEARTLFEARVTLGQSLPQLAFVSDWLQDGDGFQLVREMRQGQFGPKPYVILMSTEHVLLTWTHRRNNGADRMLLKPLYASEIKDCLSGWRSLDSDPVAA